MMIRQQPKTQCQNQAKLFRKVVYQQAGANRKSCNPNYKNTIKHLSFEETLIQAIYIPHHLLHKNKPIKKPHKMGPLYEELLLIFGGITPQLYKTQVDIRQEQFPDHSQIG